MGQGERKLSRSGRHRSHAQDHGLHPHARHHRDRRRRARRSAHAVYRRKSRRGISRRDAKFPKSTSPSIRSKARICARPALPGSITVLAASERGGLLNAPDCYMEKIVVGPSCKDAVDLDAPVADNLKNIAQAAGSRRGRSGGDGARPSASRKADRRYSRSGRAHPADRRRRSSAGIAAAVIGTGVHAVMGSGGAPEGVITAAAIRCLNGYMLGRLVVESRNRKNASRAWASKTRTASTKRKTWLRENNSSSPPPASPTARC